MNIAGVDPRDTSWEQHSATYRVYFWERGRSDEYEITEADIPEVLTWADDEARRTGRTYVAWVCIDDPQQSSGLVRLAGWERSSAEQPGEGTRPGYAVDRPTN